jgi:hypothetical protein
MLTSLLHFNVKSQEGFAFGVKAGMGYSQYFFTKPVDQNFAQVFQKGFVISQRNEKNFGLTFEIMQTQKGWEEKRGLLNRNKVIINYYEFPMLSTFCLGKGKSGVVISAGMHIGFAMKADSSNTGQHLSADTTILPPSPLKYSKFDYGVGGGIAYQFKLNRSIFQLEVMYSQSLQNFFARDYTSIYRSLNQCLYVNLTYKISVARKKEQKTVKKP